MSEALRANCHTLLTADRYNVSVVLQPLEDAVNSQCEEGWYDAELNSALLKLYQMYPSESEKVVKVDILVKILLKSLMQLPDPDFQLALMMVPEYLQTLKDIQTIANLAAKLQTAQFPEFWELVKANSDLVQRVPGFSSACRKHILRVVGMTFREISATLLASYLGLGSARDLGGALGSDSGALLNEADGTVVLSSNADNHPKTSRSAASGGQDFRLEQLAELIASLDSNSKRPYQGQRVSLSGTKAVDKLKKVASATPDVPSF